MQSEDGPEGEAGSTSQTELSKETDRLRLENEALRGLVDQVVGRIVDVPSVNGVLEEIVNCACVLTSARYGAVLLFDSLGRVQEFVTYGVNLKEWRHIGNPPIGVGLLGHLKNLQEPLRIADLGNHPMSSGFPKYHARMKTFLGAPLAARNKSFGGLYLAEKEGGGEFTRDDEATISMFAAKASTAVDSFLSNNYELITGPNLKDVIDLSTVGVLIIEATTGSILSYNQEAERVFGGLLASSRTLPELLEVMTLRRSDGSYIPPDDLPTERAIRSGEPVRGDEILVHIPGRRSFSTLWTVSPKQSSDGEVECVVIILEDLTPLNDLKRQTVDLVDSLGHELRTPLASIKGSVATLLDHSSLLDADEAQHLYRIIDQQAEYMLAVTQELSNLARFEAGVLPINTAPTEVPDILEKAREELSRNGYRNGLEFDLAPNPPPIVADERRIVQVLGILFANSARNSPDSSIIRVSTRVDSAHVAVSVSDIGVGMLPDQLPNLFGNSLRISSGSRTWQRAGGVLGLEVCKAIIENHGGEMWAEYLGPGHGSQVTFTVPIACETPTAVAKKSAREVVKDKVRVLAVDDNPNSLKLLREILSDAGFMPVSTNDPNEVERLVRANRPRVILLEPMLQSADATGLMRFISGITEAPVIFVSKLGNDRDIAQAFELGAADIVTKPFSSEELVNRIRVCLVKQTSASSANGQGAYLLGELAIDYAERRVTVGGRRVQLGAREYKILIELSRAAGRTLTYEQLLSRVWGPQHSGDRRSLRTAIKTLRRKLGDNAKRPAYIFTEPCTGYRMETETRR